MFLTRRIRCDSGHFKDAFKYFCSVKSSLQGFGQKENVYNLQINSLQFSRIFHAESDLSYKRKKSMVFFFLK